VSRSTSPNRRRRPFGSVVSHRTDVRRETVLPRASADLGHVPGVAALRRPRVIAALPVLPKPGRHPFVERRQAVALPLLQGVASKRMNAMTQDTAGTVMVQTASGVESIDVTMAMISTTPTSAHLQPLHGPRAPDRQRRRGLRALMMALAVEESLSLHDREPCRARVMPDSHIRAGTRRNVGRNVPSYMRPAQAR
jgi:hypothetical protein